MKTGFSEPAAHFKSASQYARVFTEEWAEKNIYCPNCGNLRLSKFPANRPVADFFCADCGDQFELKSQSNRFGKKVVDGAYHTKIDRLNSNTSPNLLLLHYDLSRREIRNLQVVPKFFFVPSIVERRKPLGPNARRAGWVGSNILLHKIPESGRISLVHDGSIRERGNVLAEWNQMRFLETRSFETRGWLLEVLKCVDQIGQTQFTLSDVYSFEHQLAARHPANRNVRAKIRQQLQVLRDSGYLAFEGNGNYRLRENAVSTKR